MALLKGTRLCLWLKQYHWNHWVQGKHCPGKHYSVFSPWRNNKCRKRTNNIHGFHIQPGNILELLWHYLSCRAAAIPMWSSDLSMACQCHIKLLWFAIRSYRAEPAPAAYYSKDHGSKINWREGERWALWWNYQMRRENHKEMQLWIITHTGEKKWNNDMI